MKLAPIVCTAAVLATAVVFATSSAWAQDRGWIVGGNLVAGLAGQVAVDRNVDMGNAILGAGQGFGRVKLDRAGVSDEVAGFAYRTKAGASYPPNNRLTAGLGYRGVSANEVAFASSASRLGGGLDSQAITVRLPYKLGS